MRDNSAYAEQSQAQMKAYHEMVTSYHEMIFLAKWSAVGAIAGVVIQGTMLIRYAVSGSGVAFRYSMEIGKFDFIFGRVTAATSTDLHNITRSAQNLKDLTTMGIKNEGQLLKLFDQATNNPVVETITKSYGVTQVREAYVEGMGKILVSFFYDGGNMSLVPKIVSIIPKI